MKRSIFTLFLFAIIFCKVSAQFSTMTIEVATKPVIADGIIDPSDPWVADKWVNAAQGKPDNVGEMSAKFQMMYDKTNLYFAVIVNDPDRFTGYTTTYANDCVEFFISMDTTAWPEGYYHPDMSTKQLRFQAVADPSASGGLIECYQNAPPSGQYVCVDNGSNYVQEWIMPWSELAFGMDPAWTQDQFRFDVAVSNATGDGLRSQMMFWDNASDEQWKNTTKFGIVALDTPLPLLQTGPGLTINIASKPVVTNGIIETTDPWDAHNWIDVSKAVATNVGNMSAKFQLMYDATNLYFAAVVKDADRFTGNSTTYLNDCVEFFISMDTTNWTNGIYHYDLSTKAIRFQAVADPTAAGGLVECGQTAPPSGQYVCVDNGDNYVQEWTMPWSELSAGMDPSWDQKQFRFDIQVSNASADGVRSQQLFWDNSSDLQWNNTNYFGLVGLEIPIPDLNNLSLNLGADKTVTCGAIFKMKPSIHYPGTGVLSYSWSPYLGLSATDIADPVVDIKTTQTYTLTVTSTDFGTVSDDIMVIVAPFYATAPDVQVSCGNAAQLSVITNYTGTGDLIYKWSPSTGLNAVNIPNPMATINNATNYTVEVKTPNGCIATDDAFVMPTSPNNPPSICMVTVNEYNQNLIVINKNPNEVKESFIIYRESQSQRDQFDPVGSLLYSENGIYTDTESDARVQSWKYRIAANDLCGLISENSSEHKTIHLTGIGTNGNLIWEPYQGIYISSYKIYRGTELSNLTQIGITSGGNSSYTDLSAPSGAVFYQVEGIIPEPCSALKSSEFTGIRSNIFSNTRTGLLKDKFPGQEFIYPNPASDKLYIRTGFDAKAIIEIYNLEGKQVLKGQVSEETDISGLSKGIYIVRLVEEDKVFVNRLVKK